MFKSPHQLKLTLVVLVSSPLFACGQESIGSIDEIVGRYEQEGVVERFEEGAFRFNSNEAEARFREEAGFSTATTGQALDATNWFCYGSTSHSVSAGTVSWSFYTQNNSSRLKREANVNGRVFHPSGATLPCSEDEYRGANTCNVYTPEGSGYNSATGTHECCEKRGAFGSYVCTSTFGTSDTL